MKEMNWRLSSFLGGGGGRAQGVWVEDGVANAVCDPSVSSSVRLFTSHPGQEPRAPSWAGCRQLTRWAWRWRFGMVRHLCLPRPGQAGAVEPMKQLILIKNKHFF